MADMGGADWTFRAVSPESWPDMAALFEGKGGPRPCWCMLWRRDLDGKSAPEAGPARRAAMERLALAGRQVGILGYDGQTPVAWASIAPRDHFGAGLAPDPGAAGLWALTCFYIRADHRRQSGFGALLAAAEGVARQNGASGIEAYPVDPDSPSYRFAGFVPAFEQAGYAEVGRVGQRRHVLRKAL
jgi:GNAT superfamily N-acetyltransferase